MTIYISACECPFELVCIRSDLFSRFILAYRVLAGNLKPGNTPNQMKPPPNVRVLIASRPLGDIYKSLHAALHVRYVSMVIRFMYQ